MSESPSASGGQGWVRLPRELLKNHLFHNEKLWKVFTWCLLKATWKPHELMVGRQKVKLEPGQFVFGRHAAAQELNMKPSTVWSYIKLLELDRIIDIKPNNKFSVVTVNNWELWQSDNKNPDSKLDNKRTTDGQQMDTNKNDKNDKNDKKRDSYSPEFETWFSSWPRAQAKADSFKNFERRRKEHGLEFLLRCSQNYLTYMGAIAEKERGPYYSSNNFFGQKAYYQDFVEPKKPPSLKRKAARPPM